MSSHSGLNRTVQRQILRYLTTVARPQSLREISLAVGLGAYRHEQSSLRVTLWWMATRGLVRRRAPGVYTEAMADE